MPFWNKKHAPTVQESCSRSDFTEAAIQLLKRLSLAEQGEEALTAQKGMIELIYASGEIPSEADMEPFSRGFVNWPIFKIGCEAIKALFDAIQAFLNLQHKEHKTPNLSPTEGLASIVITDTEVVIRSQILKKLDAKTVKEIVDIARTIAARR